MKEEGKHNLNIATIFSYSANEDDRDANGFIPDEDMALTPVNNNSANAHTRDQLESFISDYNLMFGTRYTTKDSQSFYDYYQDIGKRTKNRGIDLLLVVNMFLTGFDSKFLNTLYVDKNLKYHGLLQAFSRTNRVLDEKKSQGNIVCFRNLKTATDDAIALFANKDANETIIIKPYEEYVKLFNAAFVGLLSIAPTVNSVNDLKDEEEELKFIQSFRELMRLKNILTTFVDFKWDDLSMPEQGFEDYKSKYLDLYEKTKSEKQKEKVSILDDVDFELELIHRDEINVAYILKLLAKFKGAKGDEQEKQKKHIFDLLSNEVKLRSKRELIMKFIDENLPHITDTDDIPDHFDSFWNEENKKALADFCIQENLVPEKLDEVIDKYMFTNKLPRREEILDMLAGEKPGVRERKAVADRITARLIDLVETFEAGMGY
jgi:type I restriction enzyme R subunit